MYQDIKAYLSESNFRWSVNMHREYSLTDEAAVFVKLKFGNLEKVNVV